MRIRLAFSQLSSLSATSRFWSGSCCFTDSVEEACTPDIHRAPRTNAERSWRRRGLKSVVHRRRDSTIVSYRRALHKDLGDWLDRSLDDIDRRDVEQRFRQITERAGWVQTNIAVKLLGAIYRRPCHDFDDLHNPVQLWRAGGARLHRLRRRRIQPPAELLPRWHRGLETAVRNPVVRDSFRFGLYTGIRLTEVVALAHISSIAAPATAIGRRPTGVHRL